MLDAITELSKELFLWPKNGYLATHSTHSLSLSISLYYFLDNYIEIVEVSQK